jgi:hypothetical protein
MTAIFRALLIAVLLVVGLPAAALQADLSTFASEKAAQQHCPSDKVVWANTASGIYHLKGQRWYGRTKAGAYVCQQEATKAGLRGSLNGQ